MKKCTSRSSGKEKHKIICFWLISKLSMKRRKAFSHDSWETLMLSNMSTTTNQDEWPLEWTVSWKWSLSRISGATSRRRGGSWVEEVCSSLLARTTSVTCSVETNRLYLQGLAGRASGELYPIAKASGAGLGWTLGSSLFVFWRSQGAISLMPTG